MSTEENIPSGKPDDASGGDGSKTVSYESHNKLLGEKKSIQKERDELKARLDELENERLEKEGDFKKQNETLKAQLKEQKDKFSGFSQKVSEKVVKAQFAREAEKLGCIDADLAFQVCDISDLDLSENFEFDPKVLSEKIQGIMKAKPHLFKKEVNRPRDKNPSNKGPSGKSFAEMTTAELYSELGNLK